MSPLNVNLTDLIAQLDGEVGNASALDKISEAQRRSYTLTTVADQLVSHFVSQARASGASWSQIGEAIGVSKQAAQQRWVPPIYERFTDRARHVVVLAEENARDHGRPAVDTEHILLGLLGEPHGIAGKILIELAGSIEAVADAVAARSEGEGDGSARGQLPLTDAASGVYEGAGRCSVEMLHNYVGTEHILLGILTVPDGVAAQVLADLGLTDEVLRGKVSEALAGYAALRAQQRD